MDGDIFTYTAIPGISSGPKGICILLGYIHLEKNGMDFGRHGMTIPVRIKHSSCLDRTKEWDEPFLDPFHSIRTIEFDPIINMG